MDETWRSTKPVTAYLLDLFDEKMKVQGEKPTPLSSRIAGHTKLFSNMRTGNSPGAETIKAVCDALDLEFYVGPPRSIDSDTGPSIPVERPPSRVQSFGTGTTPGGFVWVEAQTPDGPVKLLLATEASKALADQLTHRAMQIEEKG